MLISISIFIFISSSVSVSELRRGQSTPRRILSIASGQADKRRLPRIHPGEAWGPVTLSDTQTERTALHTPEQTDSSVLLVPCVLCERDEASAGAGANARRSTSMPFGRKHAGVDGSSSGDGSSGTTSSSNNEENGGVDQYARFTTVLRAIEFECRLKREWQDRTCSSASTPERHDGDKDGAGPDEGGDGRSAQTNDGTSDDLPESNGLKERPFFEHFVVCGLPPDADVVAAAVSSRQAKNARQSGADAITNTSKAPAYRQPGGPMYPAQVYREQISSSLPIT